MFRTHIFLARLYIQHTIQDTHYKHICVLQAHIQSSFIYTTSAIGKSFPFLLFRGYKCVYKHTFCVVPLWMFLNWKIIYYSTKKIVFFIGDFYYYITGSFLTFFSFLSSFLFFRISILSVLVVIVVFSVCCCCHVLLFHQLLELGFLTEKYYKPPQGCILFEVVIALTQ